MTTPQQSQVGGQAPALFMVFDVESVGLHGEGFAVGWVVVNRAGEQLDEGCLACDPNLCSGTDESRHWVLVNVPWLDHSSPTPQHLRNTFWHAWRNWADQGAVLVADCAWPVEANFLAACVKLNHVEREWQGPYPLHDLASVLLALGRDPLATNERLPNELPAHHPLMDARQSARLLIEALAARHAQAAAPGVGAVVPEPGPFDRLAGRGMHELRNDELAPYVMSIAGDPVSLLQAVEWIVSELARKTNDERIIANKLELAREEIECVQKCLNDAAVPWSERSTAKVLSLLGRVVRFAESRPPAPWRPIESAPKHTDVLVWREDSGAFIAQLTTPDGLYTDEEMEREGLQFPDDFEEWFSAAYGWQEGSERPTHWTYLPSGPVDAASPAPGWQPPEGYWLAPNELTKDMEFEVQEGAHILPARANRIWAMFKESAPPLPESQPAQPLYGAEGGEHHER